MRHTATLLCRLHQLTLREYTEMMLLYTFATTCKKALCAYNQASTLSKAFHKKQTMSTANIHSTAFHLCFLLHVSSLHSKGK